MANPGRIRRCRIADPPRRPVRTALPPAARPPASHDAGRAAGGRAGSFNSGKNSLCLGTEKLKKIKLKGLSKVPTVVNYHSAALHPSPYVSQPRSASG